MTDHEFSARRHKLSDLSGLFSGLDLRFAEFIEKIGGQKNRNLFFAAAVASRAAKYGNICVDLKAAFEELTLNGVDVAANSGTLLLESPAVGKPGDYKPLILDASGRLYLQRYWKYESALAELINAKADAPEPKINFSSAAENLNRLFPKTEAAQDIADMQKIAAAASLLKNLLIISGGPGTGKTTTVVKILALLLEQNHGNALRIALAASTGKAAGRLQESILNAKAGLDCSDEILNKIPEEARTVHRLLEPVGNSPDFRRNTANPLPHDVVIVDEVSMIDLALMAKLFQAVRPNAKLILLGDKDQLASVEAGAVLGDICDTGNEHVRSKNFSRLLHKLTGEHIPETTGKNQPSKIGDCITILTRSYRFGPDSGIRRAAEAVNSGDAKKALAILTGGGANDAAWKSLPQQSEFASELAVYSVKRLKNYLRAKNPSKAFEAFDRFRVLCAHRTGPFGVEAANRIIENALTGKGLIKPKTEWYHGRPVMAARNDYDLKLYNGDVGIALRDEEDGALRVFFRAPDGTMRKFPPRRLPTCETVYAMTVHKSQGSEFDEVLLILSDAPTKLITRELIYTGATRARQRVEVWGRTEAFISAVKTRVGRTSGLRDKLWGS